MLFQILYIDKCLGKVLPTISVLSPCPSWLRGGIIQAPVKEVIIKAVLKESNGKFPLKKKCLLDPNDGHNDPLLEILPP